MGKRVMVGMSGGVDSSMTAYLLKRDGFEPTGVNCRFFNKEDIYSVDKACGTAEDSDDAKQSADKIGIPFTVLDLSEDFKNKVINNFVDVYVSGGTPNPCVVCNKYLKFDKMLERAVEQGFDYIATGHYAIIDFDSKSGRYLLKKGLDETKDQSYVLYSLNQFQLAHTLFPLGRMRKTEIRKMAEQLGFANAKKHDSQDICFVPDGDYASFIERRLGKSFPNGDFVLKSGEVMGTHKGIIRYTIGQRRGLGLALKSPLYVCEKDVINNRVILCSNEELFSKSLTAKNINLITVDRIDAPIRVKAKVRYKQPEQWATVTQIDDNRIRVEFDEPQRAFAKGQAVVLYDGDVVVGGGTIE